ncbi:26S proteasome subunit RPN7-domain-containing protein [Cantharellus anzutake]|uniref:26S proteasome subunit RPN7-domain-containing protein n=1 Tax=Cantharellus anzutake TaxID=1750568 RepID=UPI00190390E2|nr:26S proteasome subunit RPN7-domain-containing protein [Cantharellus anzutake]KAF8336548.1 26S proteasome subunit RPN7-domain-containing protein [Cantharellus anzutake]
MASSHELEPFIEEQHTLPYEGKRPVKKRSTTVVIDEDHPFDLDGYISQYRVGRNAIRRLRYIAEECPQLAIPALTRALYLLRQTYDVNQYQLVYQAYASYNYPNEGIPYDQAWVEDTQARNTSDRERLDTELKTYTSNMIKESIRMAHRDLGEYYWSVGDPPQAIKHFNKSREYSTSSQHVLEYALSVLQLLIETCDYAHISTYVFKAEGALSPPETKDKKGAAPPAGSAAAAAAASAALNPDREKAIAKMEFASGISHLSAGSYEKAAFAFSRLSRSLDDWLGKVIAPGEVAIFGVLCALASMSRNAIKVNYCENENFGIFYEQEPYIGEMLDAFMANKFKTVLELLERYSSKHSLDIHLGRHVSRLSTEIRKRSIVLYFQPFASARFEKMSAAFGISPSEMESMAVQLIQENRIDARVDSQNKAGAHTWKKDTDPRMVLYKRALKTAEETQRSTDKLLWRMKL